MIVIGCNFCDVVSWVAKITLLTIEYQLLSGEPYKHPSYSGPCILYVAVPGGSRYMNPP